MKAVQKALSFQCPLPIILPIACSALASGCWGDLASNSYRGASKSVAYEGTFDEGALAVQLAYVFNGKDLGKLEDSETLSVPGGALEASVTEFQSAKTDGSTNNTSESLSQCTEKTAHSGPCTEVSSLLFLELHINQSSVIDLENTLAPKVSNLLENFHISIPVIRFEKASVNTYAALRRPQISCEETRKLSNPKHAK